MSINWLDVLYEVFEVAVFPLLATATVYLITLIKVKKKEVLANTKNETTKKYLDMLDKTITECVLATNQTFVDTLKNHGNFTEEAQKHAFQLTYEAVMAILTEDARSYLNEAVKDLNTYITNKIEAQVVILKQPAV